MSIQRAAGLAIALAGVLCLVGLPTGCGNKPKEAKKPEPAVKPKPSAPEEVTFLVEAETNSALSIPKGDQYVKQPDGTVEVLIGWNVQCKAPKDVSEVKWTIAGAPVGTGGTLTRPAETVATDYTVTMNGKKGGKDVKGDRTIVVGAVWASKPLALTSKGVYERDTEFPNYIVSPLEKKSALRAMTMSGMVSRVDGSPPLSRFRWGFIQAVQQSLSTLKYEPYKPLSAQPKLWGQMVMVPEYIADQSIKKPANDAPKGAQLYLGNAPIELGTPADPNTWDDTPGPMFGTRILDKDDKTFSIEYAILTPNIFDIHLMVWQVVFNTNTNQYVPLVQQPWELHWDTAEKKDKKTGKEIKGWKARPLDQIPVTKMTPPTDTSVSSFDFRAPVFGPLKPFKLIK